MRVAGLSIAPVKGGRHQALARAHVGEHGLDGDRRLGFVRGNQVLRTFQHPGLLGLPFELDGDDLVLGLPGRRIRQPLPAGEPAPGASVRAEYWGRSMRLALLPGAISDAVASLLGLPATLARVVAGPGLIYSEPVSLTLLSTTEHLGIDPRRLRGNVVIDDREDPLAEGRLVGRRLLLGDVELHVDSRIDRCVVVDHDPDTGRRDEAVFARLPADDGRRALGLAARVVRPGTITVGDHAEVVGQRADPACTSGSGAR